MYRRLPADSIVLHYTESTVGASLVGAFIQLDEPLSNTEVHREDTEILRGLDNEKK